ncbi:hypothetical protein DMENIID0001_139790 [Sergentomyia squamirostris]
MGKNYYCDFCNKTFKDILLIRKNHLKGLPHQKARSAYYAQFKSLEEILVEESKKKPCKRILEGTSCNFGTQCRFSHYTPQQMTEMRMTVERKKEPSKDSDGFNEEAFREFMNRTKERIMREHFNFWSNQQELTEVQALPPSLQPFDQNQLPKKNMRIGVNLKKKSYLNPKPCKF